MAGWTGHEPVPFKEFTLGLFAKTPVWWLFGSSFSPKIIGLTAEHRGQWGSVPDFGALCMVGIFTLAILAKRDSNLIPMKTPSTLPPKPVFPHIATAESIAEYKALCREWDAARIEFRVATAAQIQEENSVVGSAVKSRILHFGKHTR
jgi:hypothetical protein